MDDRTRITLDTHIHIPILSYVSIMLESYANYVYNTLYENNNGGSRRQWILYYFHPYLCNTINRVTVGSCPHTRLLHPQSPDREFSQTVTIYTTTTTHYNNIILYYI